MVKVFVDSIGQSTENLNHLISKRAGRNNSILRTLELRGRDHFHGLGDLLRVLNRLNAPANVQEIGH